MIRPPRLTVGRLDEDDRARNEQVLRHVGMRLGIEPALGQRDVAGGIDELLELRVRHLVTVDPEAVDADDMGEALLGLMALGAHRERAAGDEHHAGGFAFLGGEAASTRRSFRSSAWSRALLDAGRKGAGQTPASTVPNPRASRAFICRSPVRGSAFPRAGHRPQA